MACVCMTTSIWHLQTHSRSQAQYTGVTINYWYFQTNDDELSGMLSIFVVLSLSRCVCMHATLNGIECVVEITKSLSVKWQEKYSLQTINLCLSIDMLYFIRFRLHFFVFLSLPLACTNTCSCSSDTIVLFTVYGSVFAARSTQLELKSFIFGREIFERIDFMSYNIDRRIHFLAVSSYFIHVCCLYLSLDFNLLC